MDFNDFLKEYSEKYGVVDEDWNNLKKNVILTFFEEEDRVLSKYKGIPVFRHKTTESNISPGETWICSLDDKQTYYFAKGLQRIDSSFMYELKKDQIDEMAAAVWNKQRHIIEPMLEEKYKEEMKDKISEAVESERKEQTVQIEALKEQIHQLEQKDVENKQIIASLTDKINNASAVETKRGDILVGETFLHAPDKAADMHIYRDGPDTISSPMFDRPRYFVHLSTDHRILLIKPHDSGNVVCINNALVLYGLSLVSQYEGPCEMTSEYNPKYGGIQVYLRPTQSRS